MLFLGSEFLRGIREQIVDVYVSQVGRPSHRSAQDPKPRPNLAGVQSEQILDVSVPEMVKQLVAVPKTVSLERSVGIPVSAGCGGTGGGLQGFLSGQGSTEFCGADHRTSCYFSSRHRRKLWR